MKQSIILIFLFAGILISQEQSIPSSKKNRDPISFSKTFRGNFHGKSISYKASHYETILYDKDDYNKPMASIFVTEYSSIKKDPFRPVIFIFNGGPGSASLWLHMGVMGPKVVKVPSDAKDDGSPPYKLVDNHLSPLDIADLVCIDPVGTGYSLAMGEHENKEFWGVKQDAKNVSQFVRQWIQENNRWNSPKYILGESYGGIRGPQMLAELRNGQLTNMEINGLILVSPVSDLQHIAFTPGNNSPYVGYLPAYAATAYYHGKIKTKKTLLEFYEEAKVYSINKLGPALLKGSRITDDEKNEVAGKISYYSGLSKQFVLNSNLRVNASSFRKELLRTEGLSVGRLDSRYKGMDYMVAGQFPDTDISSEGFSAAYVSALHTWLGEIGVDIKRLYRSGDSELFRNWDWVSTQSGWPRFLNVSPHIGKAMRENIDFKVYIACGIYDLATPCFTITNTIHENSIDIDRVKFTEFEGGHMMYNHEPSFETFLMELHEFIK
ncbi:MAG: peptidase S10 [Candidatus Marinimicrobia bacterium]|nr:peptidase S10 [Candidatus Neomarinimicrobiota bacterium]|tara:strand:- start:24305 stop:25786 length:1482 start_codon:yes stop_codon:yes gene_type:complete